MLKKYGEAADATAMRDNGFQLILGEYPIEKVEKAFFQYLKTNSEIPTPADIVKIIDPSTQPLSPVFYMALKQKIQDGAYIMPEEKRYMQRFEDAELQKVSNAQN